MIKAISRSVKKDNNVVQVIILLGQSNMEGISISSYLTKKMPQKAEEFTVGYQDVKISFNNGAGNYTSNNKFIPTKLGQGCSPNHFGPEVGIAEIIHNAGKTDVFLLKYAYGGTSLSYDWISPTSRKKPGHLFVGAVNFVLESLIQLEKMGYYPEIKAICWMQGEDDSNGNQYDNYYNYTKNFVKDLREDLKLYKDLDGIGFLDATIAALDHVWTEHVIINNAKRQNAEEDPLSYFIDTNDEGLKSNHEPVGAVDIYHYDSDSMIKLGRLFGMLLIEHFVD
jgi:hypothetical protein